jgi:hypothetical protein
MLKKISLMFLSLTSFFFLQGSGTEEKTEETVQEIDHISGGIHTKTITLEDGSEFEIAPFIGNEAEKWAKGQKVKIEKSDNILFSVKLSNIDADDSIEVRYKR